MKSINNRIQFGFDGDLTERELTAPFAMVVPEHKTFSVVVLQTNESVDLSITLAGDGAKCDVKVVYLGSGLNKNNLKIDMIHQHPNTQSIQQIQGVLADESQMIFDGIIRIPRDSQQCDGIQNHRALLLSENALVRATPQLEIYADDVKCAHGSTVSALDQKELFYAMARGIPMNDAKHLLVKAFLSNFLPESWEHDIDTWMETEHV